jgi:hypothetical protein
MVPQAFYQIHEPPPRPRRLNGDASPAGDLGEKLLQLRRIVLQSLLRDLPVWHQHGELRAPLMQVHAHVYHRFALLPPSGMSFCSSLFPDSEGGQRSYGIRWLRALATGQIRVDHKG